MKRLILFAMLAVSMMCTAQTTTTKIKNLPIETTVRDSDATILDSLLTRTKIIRAIDLQKYIINYTVQGLTVSSKVVTWNVANGINAGVTLISGDTYDSLSIVGAKAGRSYKIRITQPAAGTVVGLKPVHGQTWKVSGNGTGAITLSVDLGDVDILNVYFDGTNYWLTLTKQFN